MTTFNYVMAGLVSIFGFVSWLLVRKGGVWNPPFPDEETPLKPNLPTNMPKTDNVPPTPINTPVTPVLSHTDPLKTFCDSIAAMEGANPANNNEGNTRCSPVGYAPMYGKVICNKNNFAVFPTKALGRMYLENLVHFRVIKHPTWTFLDFFNDYAPAADSNDPNNYAHFVATRCGCAVDKCISDYFNGV